MFKNKRILFVFSIVLLLVVLVAGQAAAAPGRGAAVRLEVDKASFLEKDTVTVHITISNPTDRAVKVLKWFTPVDDVEESLFTVTRDGQPVQYIGALYKRPAPTSGDYVALKPGASFSRDVDLSAYYDFSVAGNYEVSYNVSAWNLYSEKGGGLFAGAQTMSSDKVQFYAAAKAGGISEPLAVTGSTTYNKCTASQQSSLVSARSQASTYSADALSYLKANKTGLRYTTWFGVMDSGRYSTVTNHFTAISSAMDTASVTFDCGCRKKYYAYVYPTKPYVIYLCSVFWTAPLTGTDSKAGTLIHEMSHFNVVASTNDYVYGQTNAKNLAISNPDQAIGNADNHEYFAENTPSQP